MSLAERVSVDAEELTPPVLIVPCERADMAHGAAAVGLVQRHGMRDKGVGFGVRIVLTNLGNGKSLLEGLHDVRPITANAEI